MNIKADKCVEDSSLTFTLEEDIVKFEFLMGMRYPVRLSTVFTINTHNIYVNKNNENINMA